MHVLRRILRPYLDLSERKNKSLYDPLAMSAMDTKGPCVMFVIGQPQRRDLVSPLGRSPATKLTTHLLI